MNADVLKIANATNTFMDDYQIGNILNKNLLIRNIAIMRNIGKYSMYNQMMFPEIGMAYNINERVLTRPSDIGVINGVIGYNNAIDDDTPIAGKGNEVTSRFINLEYTPKTTESLNKKRKGKGKDNEEISDAEVNNVGETLKKTVYVTNSNSVERSGGEIALGEVMKTVNKIFLSENKYVPEEIYSFGLGGNSVDDFGGMSVDRPTILSNVEKLIGHNRTFDSRDTDEKYLKTYSEGTAINVGQVSMAENQNISDHLTVEFMTDEENFAAINNTTGALLKKTNALFHQGKIGSLIARFYAEEEPAGDDFPGIGGVYLSRGKNLHKKASAGLHHGGGYDNPYCRVWTIHNQYTKMTDLIRPRIDDETGGFATLQRIQAPYGDGLRPALGASRLSDMSVLKSNGFVNIAPHKDKDGGLDKDSIKKCMFSIENLAWKDIVRENDNKYVARNIQGKNKSDDKYKETEEYAPGGTLSEEQIGPNGGRIMWFPPYNIKFSEDIVTNWNNSTFIGRGENMYTYINTERGGQLSFTLLIDHPSIVNKWKNANPDDNNFNHEEQILRFFAGCDELGEESINPTMPVEVPAENEGVDINRIPVNPKETIEFAQLKVFVFFPNNYSGVDDSSTEFSEYLYYGRENENNIPYESSSRGTELREPIKGPGQIWYYKVDDKLVPEKLVRFETGYTKTTSANTKFFLRTLNKIVPNDTEAIMNNHDVRGFTLNAYTESTLNQNMVAEKMRHAGFITADEKYGEQFFSYKDLFEELNGNGDQNSNLWKVLNKYSENIEMIELRGYASSHGHKVSNDSLCIQRAQSVQRWIASKKPSIDADKYTITSARVVGLETSNHDVCSLDAKLARSVEVIFHMTQNKEGTKFKQEVKKVPEKQRMYEETLTEERIKETYDNEYLYFKDLYENDSFIKSRIIEKVNYFDPAYHSITPEGFNARLTFLQQCTRQGPTVSVADENTTFKDTGVGNLAFGRAPYCILRIGDFYNTKILIENINIDYNVGNGVQWDLNPEGVGVQPMMAEVSMRFKFVGGSDISGPIERLQNAVSFNYYSNTSIYERRSDYRNSFVDTENKEAGDEANPVKVWDARTQGHKPKKKE